MRLRRSLAIGLLGLLLLLAAADAPAEDWRRFRGPNGTGVSDSKGVPTEFGPQRNVAWAVDVPFGRSSPVVSGDRIYLTATEDGKFVTLAIERKTGKLAWKRSVATSVGSSPPNPSCHRVRPTVSTAYSRSARSSIAITPTALVIGITISEETIR